MSSREEIERESEWNKAILEQIPAAFLATISQVRDSHMRYLWPYYLPSRPTIDDFFQSLWPEMLAILGREAVLESTQGTLFMPSNLSLVPVELADQDGRSLIPPECSTFNYASPNYPFEVSGALRNLGVRDLSTEDFLDDLSQFAVEWPDRFQSMPAEWHSRLSEILDHLTLQYEERIMSIPFVHLHDDRWISLNSGRVWFPVTSDGLVVPKSMEALVVHPKVAKDHSRRNLLQKLKAQEVDNTAVGNSIVKTHQSETFKPNAIPTSHLVSHVVFLFEAGWKPEALTKEKIWVATIDGSAFISSFVYLNSREPYSARQVVSTYKDDSTLMAHYPFLHARYYEKFSGIEQRTWLQDNLGLSTVPRLVHPQSQPPKTILLDLGFEALTATVPSLELLQILKNNWTQYRRWIISDAVQTSGTELQGPDKTNGVATEELSSDKLDHGFGNSAGKTANSDIKSFLSKMIVQCQEGTAQLSQTCLSRKSVLLGMSEPEDDQEQSKEPRSRDIQHIQLQLTWPLIQRRSVLSFLCLMSLSQKMLRGTFLNISESSSKSTPRL